MSALGQKQTLNRVHPMSAIPPKADIDRYGDAEELALIKASDDS